MARPGPPSKPVPVVGIGASAGGLEAFTAVLRQLPADTGMAFVLIQHLDPRHDSILASLLGRATPMPVEQARDGEPVRPNRVAVIPPGHDMTIRDGRLSLHERGGEGKRHLPVDRFFRSLAAAQGEQAIGVVLSGTGSDGALGCRAIKDAGGIVIAQEPGSAGHDGMPRNAIAAGCIDVVLAPAELAAELARLAREPYVRGARARPVPPVGEKEGLDRVLALLRRETGVDFFSYKRPTLMRRINRRMVLLDIDRLAEYERRLKGEPAELQALYDDLLINVTSFFRDPATFEALSSRHLPPMLRDLGPDSSLRLWVAGCSTGEEVYSLAICALEAAAAAAVSPTIQLFGTDLSARAIARARAGVYLESIAAAVSPERLSRFFVKRHGNYQVSKAVRDLCVFARHDLMRDPSFSRLDLISCRNVLIYLETTQQKRLLAGFHYALRPSGLLLLGGSETVGPAAELFALRDREHHLYAPRQGVARTLGAPAARRPASSARRERAPATAADQPAAERRWAEVQRLLLQRYVPPALLVDDDLEVLEFRGDTEPFVHHAHGSASLNLLKIARPGLAPPLQQLLREARERGGSVRREDVRMRRGHRALTVAIEVLPVGGDGAERAFLVVFEPARQAEASRATASPPVRGERAKDRRIADLEQELTAARQQLQATTEEHEAANEELQSANEEVLASNEELQSLNEELETAKEELQSGNEELSTLNEELSTLNEELGHRNAELSLLSDDLKNLFQLAGVPILVVDSDLRLRRWTPAAADLFNLLDGDISRPLGKLRPKLEIPDLEPWIRSVIAAGASGEREARDRDGRQWSVRVAPYRRSDQPVGGAMIVAHDIGALRRLMVEAEMARDFADAIVATNQPLLVLDAERRVERVNRAFLERFGVSGEAVIGRPFFELDDHRWDLPPVRRLIDDLPLAAAAAAGVEFEQDFADRGRKTIELHAMRLLQSEDVPRRLLLTIDDRTEDRRTAAALLAQAQAAWRQAEAAGQLKDEFVATVSHELRGPLNAMVGWLHLLGVAPDEAAAAEARAALDRSIQAQARLISDLFDMTRILSGKVTLARQWVPLLSVVGAALETARTAAEAKGVRLALARDSTSEVVVGDPDRLQQIVWNLLSNAVKFTPRDGEVEVTLTREGTQAVLRVRDTGRGIPPGFLPYVFDRFRQADATPSRREAGLGLGLAIARELVELHGGTVAAASDGEGLGSTFTLSLPVAPLAPFDWQQGRPEDGAASEEESRPAVPDPTVLAGVRVLVVEDDPEGCNVLARVLAAWGAEVVAAHSTAEALRAFVSRAPDVVVSDIGMAGEDGYDLVRQVRALPPASGGRVPALALTAFASPADRRRALAAGFQDHLAKPADPAELAARIAALVPPRG